MSPIARDPEATIGRQPAESFEVASHYRTESSDRQKYRR